MIADANPLISVLLGGAARQILILWAEDKDFLDIPEIILYRTKDLLAQVEKT
jgi:hypothetical protein